jgi:hypothetical protein
MVSSPVYCDLLGAIHGPGVELCGLGFCGVLQVLEQGLDRPDVLLLPVPAHVKTVVDVLAGQADLLADFVMITRELERQRYAIPLLLSPPTRGVAIRSPEVAAPVLFVDG